MSRQLGKMLTTNWSSEFDELTTQLQLEILNVSSKKVEMLSVAQIAEAVLNATKAWSDVGVIGILLTVGLLLLERKVCSIQKQQWGEWKVLLQAMAALEEGISPRVWLMLDQ